LCTRSLFLQAVLKREVRRFKAQHVRCGSALGELNHPSYYSAYFRSLNLPNISHQVLEVRWRGNELWGTIEVLPTPAGLLLWELYSRVSSSRGGGLSATTAVAAEAAVRGTCRSRSRHVQQRQWAGGISAFVINLQGPEQWG
jgi:hypothetical protein